jgi:hypothetical protein
MAISWNTGTTVDDANTQAASQTVTIPAGVLAGDIIIIVVTGWATAVPTETIQASSTGTAPVIIGTTQSVADGTLYLQAVPFYVIAGASDAGKVITVSFVSGDTAKWTIALGAWTGASNAAPVDVSGSATAEGVSSTLTCPTEATGVSSSAG